jgi:anaerobic dimethyl sulfoxide reductase subunit A
MDTRTKKVEVFTDSIADPKNRNQEHFDFKGRKYAHCPNDWKDIQPIAVYHPCYNGFEGFPAGKLAQYPLFLLTNKSRYAIHYLMGDPGNPRIRDVKRHGLWISGADAKARGIKDNDAVRIYNTSADGAHEWPDPATTLNQVVVRAYVTNRIMPGVALLRTGNRPNYATMTPQGIRLDINLGPETMSGGATNQFTGGDDTSPITPAKVVNLVQVEKFAGGQWYRGA